MTKRFWVKIAQWNKSLVTAALEAKAVEFDDVYAGDQPGIAAASAVAMPIAALLTNGLEPVRLESLQIEKVNNAPTARNDAAPTDEDTPLSISPASLLANDSDADHLDVIAVVDADAQSALGAAITVYCTGMIYASLFDPAAQEVLGKVGPATEGVIYVRGMQHVFAIGTQAKP